MPPDARSAAASPMLRTASSEGAVQLQHPIPDLQSLQGAYVQNVERLEETAERMSEASSDIGEEIRKLHLEQKLSSSRRSSLLSVDEENAAVVARPRNVSTGSFSNSIVDVNNAARCGGYSPGGYIGSPRGSLRSGSWSQVSATAHIARHRSASKGSRLGQVSKLDEDADHVQAPLNDPTWLSHDPRLDGLHISNDDSLSKPPDQTSPRDASSGVRMPSDGAFTSLYNQMVESNDSAPHMAAPRIPSDTAFTDVYDQFLSEIREQLHDVGSGVTSPALNSATQPTPADKGAFSGQRRSRLILEQIDDRHLQFRKSVGFADEGEPEAPRPILQIHRADSADQHTARPLDDALDRPATAASTDTYQQAQMLFEDFDGAHFVPSIQGASRDPSGASASRPPSMMMMMAPPNVDSRIPPPAPGMVYYPAPVPRTLNLPQRLSQLPSPQVLAKRRTQMLSGIPAEVRKSAPWLAHEQGRGVSGSAILEARRSSIAPQLRASMFFETPGPSQEVEMIDDSAVATLEDMLDASAVAPVSAFTDHPIVGHIGAEVYRREAPAKGTASSAVPKPNKADKKKRRSSMLGIRRHSVSSTDRLRDENNKTPSKLRKRSSRSNSLAGALDDSALARDQDGGIRGSKSTEAAPARRLRFEDEEERADDEDNAVEDEEEEVEEEEEEEEEEEDDTPYAGPPTTLLAELQQRKAQQKLRNRTAATAFPNGMHATLLEMDAVLQLQKQKRKKARVALAWEDPDALAAADAADQDDDEVPLGMLFPSKKKRDPADWNRPLGLLEKRELEENEPLSRRRNRLLGIDFTKRTPSPDKARPEVQVTIEEDDESEHEGETLGQRLRRLKNEKQLDDALGEVRTRPISQAFSTEMLNELGVSEDKPEDKTDDKRQSTGSQEAKSVVSEDNPTPNRSSSHTPEPVEEEETLGQRRARLQREALAQNRRASQMSLGDGLANGPQQRASTMLQPPGTTPPLNTSRSMADLLQQFPAGKNESRKISNEALTSALPPGSLLAKNEEKRAAQKARVHDSTKRVTTYGHDSTLLDTTGMMGPAVEAHKSGGFMGGMYNNASGGLISAADRGLMLAATEQQQAQAQAAMLYAYQTGFAYPGLFSPYAAAAAAYPYGYPANAMYAPAPPAAAAAAAAPAQPAHVSMTNPNLLLHNMGGALNRQSRPHLPDVAYQPVQRLATMPTQHQQEEFLDQRGRDRIDAWRLGVTP